MQTCFLFLDCILSLSQFIDKICNGMVSLNKAYDNYVLILKKDDLYDRLYYCWYHCSRYIPLP